MNTQVWPSGRPTNLHIAHSWGGGLAVWVKDFCEADEFSENIVLESFGSASCYGIGLRLRHPKSGTILDSWVLQDPISEVRVSHSEHAEILQKICQHYGVDHIYISSLIGQSLAAFKLNIAVTVIYHDYFPYCAAFFLTRETQCTSCSLDDLKLCKSISTDLRPKHLPSYYPRFRDAYFEALAGACVSHVAPSHSVPGNLRRVDSRFEAFRFSIIEHGIPFRSIDTFGGAEDNRRLRVGVLGYLDWHKGLGILERCFDIARAITDLYFIGTHDPTSGLVARWGAHYIHDYEREKLPDILGRCRLDLALFLPLVPESFSYTLSEVQCFCIPPLARRIGAHGERIENGSDGFLFDVGDEDLVDSLLYLDRSRDELRAVAARLQGKPVRTVTDAVGDYYSMREGSSEPRSGRSEAAVQSRQQGLAP